MIKVLIVDDSEVFRESIKECLQDQAGIAIVGLAENGDECLKFLDKTPVDLVLMDARMSGLDGPHATQELKKKYPHTKVIICTIWAEKEARNYALQAGADDYFVKGDPLFSLREKIDRLFK